MQAEILFPSTPPERQTAIPSPATHPTCLYPSINTHTHTHRHTQTHTLTHTHTHTHTDTQTHTRSSCAHLERGRERERVCWMGCQGSKERSPVVGFERVEGETASRHASRKRSSSVRSSASSKASSLHNMRPFGAWSPPPHIPCLWACSPCQVSSCLCVCVCLSICVCLSTMCVSVCYVCGVM